MILTAEQREKVEQNIRLVRKVINDKVHGPYQLGIYTYDDIFQIGCIGLCKAAATDKGGTFSTYAYRLIWNEICDALIYSTRRQATELSSDMIPLVAEDPTVSIADVAAQQRALARTGRADDDDNFLLLDREVDALEHLDVAKIGRAHV